MKQHSIATQLAAVREQLERADKGYGERAMKTQIGHLLIAISELTDAVERLSESHERLAAWMDAHEH
jgi:hypothetical protein